MKKLIFLLIVLLGVAGYFWYQTPFYAFNALKDAANENDAQRFDALVDKDAVRAALAQDFSPLISVSSSDPMWPDNKFAKAAQKLRGTMVGKALAPVLTPSGLHQLITRGTLDRNMFGLPPVPKKTEMPNDIRDATETADDTQEPEPLKATEDYESFNYFKVKLESEGEVKPVTLIFKRYHLISWKLVRIGFGF